MIIGRLLMVAWTALGDCYRCPEIEDGWSEINNDGCPGDRGCNRSSGGTILVLCRLLGTHSLTIKINFLICFTSVLNERNGVNAWV